jgi:F-type H+-transporting ATPase subunit gamma
VGAILSVREIKRKIKSVGNIKKITRAMQMVSAAKLKKVQERLVMLRPYADKIRAFQQGLSSQVADLNYPLFQPRPQIRGIGLVVMMADKGLCGSYNTNITRYLNKFRKDHDAPPRVLPIGKKAVEYFAKRDDIESVEGYFGLPTEVPFSTIKSITRTVTDWFLKEEVDQVHLLFTRYVNALTFTPGHVQFLPIEPDEEEPEEGTVQLEHHYEFEPDPAGILEKLIPRYIEVTFHRLLLESFASEHAARMNAMRNATDNATELIDDLTLTYNKARQSGITRELLDIVGGAEALKG